MLPKIFLFKFVSEKFLAMKQTVFDTFAVSIGKALMFVMIYVLEKPTFNQLD